MSNLAMRLPHIIADVHTRISAAVRSARHHLPVLTPSSWLALAVPLALCLSLIVSVGPEMQQSVFSAIDNDAPSLYGAAYDDSIKTFPDLLGWWSLSAWWLNLLIGGLIALLALRATELKDVMLATAIASAVVLTLADFAGAAVQRNFDIQIQIANVAANSVGGTAIGMLIGIGLALYAAATTIRLPRLPVLLLSASTLVGFGLATSAAAFFALRFVYELLPANVAATLNTPTSGFYSADAQPASKREASEESHFNFLPVREASGGMAVSNAKGPIHAEWLRSRDANPFDVEMALLSNCLTDGAEDGLVAPSSISRRNVRNVVVTFDEGSGDFHAAPGNHRLFEVQTDRPTHFWLERDEPKGLWEVTHFTSVQDKLVVSTSASLRYRVGAYLVGREAQRIVSRPRTLNVNIDGEAWRFRFEPTTPVLDAPVRCHPLKLDAEDAEHRTVSLAASHVSALISITHSDLDVVYAEPEGRVTVTGVGGWASITEIPDKSFERDELGAISLVIAHSNVSDLEVDGASVPIRSNDAAVLVGDLTAEFGAEQGSVYISGLARMAWRNQTRLNSTRWERLPTEWRIALLTAFVALLFGIARFVGPRLAALQHEDVKSWPTRAGNVA